MHVHTRLLTRGVIRVTLLVSGCVVSIICGCVICGYVVSVICATLLISGSILSALLSPVLDASCTHDQFGAACVHSVKALLVMLGHTQMCVCVSMCAQHVSPGRCVEPLTHLTPLTGAYVKRCTDLTGAYVKRCSDLTGAYVKRCRSQKEALLSLIQLLFLCLAACVPVM